jgi:peptidoglycan/LPS O-acetylase OafA/YrhL
MVTSTAPARLPSLTGLRWVAAFLVFGYHVWVFPIFDGHASAQGVLRVLFGQGDVGVSFFYILSGVVLTWSARPADTVPRFWRRRAARIFPAHVVTWLLLLIPLAYAGRAGGLGQVLPGLFLVQAWVPDQSVYYAVNTPAWSLSCEVAFYAAFPLLLPAVRRVRDDRLAITAVAIVAAVWCVPLCWLVLPGDLAYWFTYVLPLTRGLEFALGMVLARMLQAGRRPGPGLRLSALLAVIAYVGGVFLPGPVTYAAATVVPLAWLIAAAADADARGLPSPLRAPALIRLGEISFAFYLVHQPVIRFAGEAGRGRWPLPVLALATAGALVLAVSGAWLLHRVVERPMERRLRGPRHERPREEHPLSPV